MSSPPSPIQRCPLKRLEIVCADGTNYDSAKEPGHNLSLSLERVGSAIRAADLTLKAHDETIDKQLFSLALEDLLSSSQAPHDAISIEIASLRVRILGPAEEFRCMLELVRAGDFHRLSAVLQRIGFVVMSVSRTSTAFWTAAPVMTEQPEPRLTSITTLPGADFRRYSPLTGSIALDSRSPSGPHSAGPRVPQSSVLYSSRRDYFQSNPESNSLDNAQMTAYSAASNPYNVFNKTASLDPYRPRESSPLRNRVTQVALPTANSFSRASLPRMPASLFSNDLLRQAVGRRKLQSQSTESSQTSSKAPSMFEPTVSCPVLGSGNADRSVERSPVSTVNRTFDSLLPPSRHLPFNGASRKRSADSLETESDLESFRPSRTAQKLRLQPGTSPAPRESSDETPVSVKARPRVSSRQRRPSKRWLESCEGEQNDAKLVLRMRNVYNRVHKATPPTAASASNARSSPKRPVTSKKSKRSKRAAAKDQSSRPENMLPRQNTAPASAIISKNREPAGRNPSVQSQRTKDESSTMNAVEHVRAEAPPEMDNSSQQAGLEETESGGARRRSLRLQTKPIVPLRPSKVRINDSQATKGITRMSLRSQTTKVSPAKEDLTANSIRMRKVQLAEKAKRDPREIAQSPAKKKSLPAEPERAKLTRQLGRAVTKPGTLLETSSSTTPLAPAPFPLSGTHITSNVDSRAEILTAVSLRPVKASFKEMESRAPPMVTAQSHRQGSRSVTMPKLPSRPPPLQSARSAQPETSIAPRQSLPGQFSRPMSISSYFVANRTNIRKPILITSAILNDVNETTERFVDQYREDKCRGLDQKTLEQYYGFQIVQAQTQYWLTKLANKKDIL